MTQAEFRSMVVQNSRWFEGVSPETADSIRKAEQQLGCALPSSMKWLLSMWGYSSACGIASLDDTVADTLNARRTLGLEERYIILNNWQDGGYVVMDTVKP